MLDDKSGPLEINTVIYVIHVTLSIGTDRPEQTV